MSNSGDRAESGHLAKDSVNNEIGVSKQQDFVNAKAFLLKQATPSGSNLYDHLSHILSKILAQRPDNVLDIFEELSANAKKNRYHPLPDTIKDHLDVNSEVALAEIQKRLFIRSGDDEMEAEDVMESPLPNLWEMVYFFEQAGVGLAREEMYRIFLSLKQLVDREPLQNVKFWGKIFGTEQNYIVAECEYKEGEGVEEEEEENEDDLNEGGDGEEAEEGEVDEFENLKKPEYKKPKEIPKEKGSGTNKKVYFVCNDPGKPWVRLPIVSPAQIQVARKVRKLFTGRLDAAVVSFPPFPGTEQHYLRAQIARISAGTHIAPNNLFTTGEDEGEDEDGGARETFENNPDYQPLTARELADPSLENWVHIVPHILPQGRCQWFDPTVKGEDFEAEDEDEERAEPNEPQREEGPGILSPCSQDQALNGVRPWTTHVSSRLIPQYAIAVVHHNLWPGAHAFGYENKFENLYVGWGLKYSPTNFSPELPPAPQTEYPSGPEIQEIEDPTPEMEAAAKAEQKGEEEEEMGEEEGEGEDDEEEE